MSTETRIIDPQSNRPLLRPKCWIRFLWELVAAIEQAPVSGGERLRSEVYEQRTVFRLS